MSQAVLSISGLHAAVEGKEILKGVDLEVKQGEIHALMGPERLGQEHARLHPHGSSQVRRDRRFRDLRG